MKSIREILPDVCRQEAAAKQTDEELLLLYWASTVGPEIAKRTRPLRISRKRLFVEVTDRSWHEQLASLGQQITKKLNKALGREIIEKILFRTAAPPRIPPQKATRAAVSADDGAGIEDPHLRRIYSRSRSQVRKRAKSS